MVRHAPARYVAIIESNRRPVDRSILDSDELLVGREGRLSVFYCPIDAVNTRAQIVLLGLTPGWRQMQLAIDNYRLARQRGLSVDQAQEVAKGSASFAGMRNRLVGWLDGIGLQRRLGVSTTGRLFDDRALLHTTSLIRYPVFTGSQYENYRGTSPRVQDSPLLTDLIRELLVPELASVPAALVVPMGRAVSSALIELRVTDMHRCLLGFPHPSGANGHGPRQFEENRSAMTNMVQSWAFV